MKESLLAEKYLEDYRNSLENAVFIPILLVITYVRNSIDQVKSFAYRCLPNCESISKANDPLCSKASQIKLS